VTGNPSLSASLRCEVSSKAKTAAAKSCIQDEAGLHDMHRNFASAGQRF
jgi:hypothetical protein